MLRYLESLFYLMYKSLAQQLLQQHQYRSSIYLNTHARLGEITSKASLPRINWAIAKHGDFHRVPF